MAKGERLPLSKNSGAVTVVLVMMLLQGCARNAPALPDAQDTTYTPAPNTLSNQDIVAEKCNSLDIRLKLLGSEAQQLTDMIQADRGRNQAAGYFGALFLVPLVALKEHPAEKQRLDEIQVERDAIYAEKKQYRCP